MPTKRGSELARRVYVLGADRHDDAVAAIDAELQEVRDVLYALVTFVFDEGDGQGPRLHWCQPEENTTPDCTPDCQRARALYEKLRTDK